jgi:hypothetical protein
MPLSWYLSLNTLIMAPISYQTLSLDQHMLQQYISSCRDRRSKEGRGMQVKMDHGTLNRVWPTIVIRSPSDQRQLEGCGTCGTLSLPENDKTTTRYLNLSRMGIIHCECGTEPGRLTAIFAPLYVCYVVLWIRCETGSISFNNLSLA